MNQSFELQQAIRQAMQTEKDAMDFYRLAAKKIADPEAKATFAMLAREERQHAYSFYNLYRGDDIDSFEEFIAEPLNIASNWCEALQQLDNEGGTERTAFRLAIQLERALEISLRKAAAEIERPEVRAIYLANAASTHGHCQSIEQECLERYGEVC